MLIFNAKIRISEGTDKSFCIFVGHSKFAYMKNISLQKLLLLCLLTAACGESREKDEEQIQEVAEGFASAFFNMDFDRAASFCAPESFPWVRFKASNITEKDLEVYNREQRMAKARLDRLTFSSDTTAAATCQVAHVLLTDSLERQAIMVPERTFRIPLVKRDGKWLIRMEGPLQSAE